MHARFLQARTKKTSGRGLGTVFSAAVAKEANTAAVEGRINSQGSLIGNSASGRVL